MLHAKWQRTRFGAKTTRTWNVPRSNLVISQIHKNIVRHTAHTIVSWPNPNHDRFPFTGQTTQSFDDIFVANMNKPLKKQSYCRPFKTHWRFCDITLTTFRLGWYDVISRQHYVKQIPLDLFIEIPQCKHIKQQNIITCHALGPSNISRTNYVMLLHCPLNAYM